MTYTNVISKTNNLTYKVAESGTAYHLETPDKLVRVLENARINRKRIRVYLGDVKTGKNWNEEHDIMGYIGRSTGSIKIPLLIYNERSYGGGAILDNCILKVKESKGDRILYQVDNYTPSTFEIKESTENGYTHALYIDGKLYSNHKTIKDAEKLKNKMQ